MTRRKTKTTSIPFLRVWTLDSSFTNYAAYDEATGKLLVVDRKTLSEMIKETTHWTLYQGGP